MSISLNQSESAPESVRPSPTSSDAQSGKLSPGEAVSTCATTAPPSDGEVSARCPCCQGDGSCCASPKNTEEEQLLSKLHAVAYSPSDVNLSQCFADQTGLSCASAGCRLMIVRMVRMLHMCDYTMEHILAVMSMALVHLERIYGKCDARMDDTERASIAVLQCFNAHCFVMDESCPLKYWKRNIYSDYCSVQVLNSASMKLFKILQYNLSVKEDERLQKEALLRAAIAS